LGALSVFARFGIHLQGLAQWLALVAGPFVLPADLAVGEQLQG
jgi:hypothetical protein